MEKSKKVAGIINAGGKGTRLHPVTLEIPKPLLTIGRRPIIQYQVELFRKYDISPIYVSVSKDDATLFERWKDEYENNDIIFIIEKERLGTWGGIRKFLTDQNYEGTFIVSNGDELKEFDLSKLIAFHTKEKALITIGAIEVENPSDYSVLEIEKGGKVKAFHYKPMNPPSNLTHAGTHVVDSSVLKLFPDQKVLSFEEDVVPIVLMEGKIYECQLQGRWHDCGTFERYEKAIYDWTGKTKL